MNSEEWLICELLNCGSRDIEVITRIDENIVYDAIKEIKLEKIELDMPTLFQVAANVAVHSLGISPDDVEINCNYCCSAICIAGKVSKKKIKDLEKLGFLVD